MRIRLLTDVRDAYIGLRLAGAVCELVQTGPEFTAALQTALTDEDCGILLITQGLYTAHRAAVDDAKQRSALPLITEIPDTGSEFDTDAITRYMIDAIGAG